MQMYQQFSLNPDQSEKLKKFIEEFEVIVHRLHMKRENEIDRANIIESEWYERERTINDDQEYARLEISREIQSIFGL